MLPLAGLPSFLLLLFSLLHGPTRASQGASQTQPIDPRPVLVVETLVTADDTVTRRFDSRYRAEQYLSEVIRLANVLLRDRHLPLRIELRIVSFQFLSHIESGAVFNTSHLTASVQAFCRWAHRRYHSLRSYDYAVFFSQRIQSRAAGVSPLGKMCQHPLSCTIVEDTGFTFVFNLVHELLHSFGIEHDSEGNSCRAQSPGGNIMAPTVRSSWARYQWSQCTVDALTRLSRNNTFTCVLTTAPSRFIATRQVQWNRADQCRVLLDLPESYTFHVNPNFCPESCVDTWCPTIGEEKTCVSYSNVAPPPGFVCGPGKVCLNGQCDPGPVRRLPLLPWSSCEPCTGSGVSLRTRRCPPAQPNCVGGRHLELRACAAPDQTCIARKRDYRERKCLATLGSNVKTAHFFEAPCTVICQTNGNYVPIDTVPNGTPCHFNSSADLCVEGKCVAVDCRGRVGGGARSDACGVCEGDGSSCTAVAIRIPITADVVSGSSLHQFPRGAKDILITKASSAFSIALVDMERRTVVNIDLTNSRMAGLAYGVLLQRQTLPSGFDAIEAKGTLLSANLQLRMRWLADARPDSSVEVSYTRAIIMNRAQMR